MAINFKFSSTSTVYDSISFDGDFMALWDLKDAIAERKFSSVLQGGKKKYMERFDFRVYDAETLEEVVGRVRKNSSVLVKRLPVHALQGLQNGMMLLEQPRPAPIAADDDDDDDFGDDVYSTSSGGGPISEEASPSSGEGPPASIRVSIEPEKEKEKKKKKTVAVAVSTGDGSTAKGATRGHGKPEVPLELYCLLCGTVMKDPVMIPCCCYSFCDHCIRAALVAHNGSCPKCESGKCSVSDLLPNRHLKPIIDLFLRSHAGAPNSIPQHMLLVKKDVVTNMVAKKTATPATTSSTMQTSGDCKTRASEPVAVAVAHDRIVDSGITRKRMLMNLTLSAPKRVRGVSCVQLPDVLASLIPQLPLATAC